MERTCDCDCDDTLFSTEVQLIDGEEPENLLPLEVFTCVCGYDCYNAQAKEDFNYVQLCKKYPDEGILVKEKIMISPKQKFGWTQESNTFLKIYSDAEIIEAWSTEGQGHKEVISGAYGCVSANCKSLDDALNLSRMFLRMYALPTCIYWDGNKEITFYCGSPDLQERMGDICNLYTEIQNVQLRTR